MVLSTQWRSPRKEVLGKRRMGVFLGVDILNHVARKPAAEGMMSDTRTCRDGKGHWEELKFVSVVVDADTEANMTDPGYTAPRPCQERLSVPREGPASAGAPASEGGARAKAAGAETPSRGQLWSDS